MTIAVRVEPLNGAYSASVLGSPELHANGETKSAAVASLQSVILPQVAAGDLVFLDIEPRGIADLATKYKNDPAWQEAWDAIAAEAYRYRDEEKAREFPE